MIIETLSMSCFRDCRSEPGQRAQRLLAGPTSHSVAVRYGSTMISLSTERARENETNLRNGSSGPWTRTVRSPASARTDQVLEEGGIGGRGVCESGSGGLHDSPLDDETRGHVFPQRHEQLARQGDEQRLLDAPAIGLDAIFEPQRQGRFGLMAAHSQANSIRVARKRGLPALEAPCSQAMLPLRHGVARGRHRRRPDADWR